MGPKDSQLQRRVIEALALDRHLDPAKIEVVVRDGVVTLSGAVSTFAHELAAVRAARRVAGVHGIDDRLQIELAPSMRRKLQSYVKQHGYAGLD